MLTIWYVWFGLLINIHNSSFKLFSFFLFVWKIDLNDLYKQS